MTLDKLEQIMKSIDSQIWDSLTRQAPEMKMDPSMIKIKPYRDGRGGLEVTMYITDRELHDMKLNLVDMKEAIREKMMDHVRGIVRDQIDRGQIDRLIAEEIRRQVKEIVAVEVEERVTEFFGDDD